MHANPGPSKTHRMYRFMHTTYVRLDYPLVR